MSDNLTGNLRDRIAAAVQSVTEWPAPNRSYDVADAVTYLLIDMAGKGELLQSIDRMHRASRRSAEKLGLTGDGE